MSEERRDPRDAPPWDPRWPGQGSHLHRAAGWHWETPVVLEELQQVPDDLCRLLGAHHAEEFLQAQGWLSARGHCSQRWGLILKVMGPGWGQWDPSPGRERGGCLTSEGLLLLLL